MPPLVIAAGIAAAGSIGASAIGAHAAGSAADKQIAAEKEAQAQFQPFQQAGASVLPGLTQTVASGGAAVAPFTGQFTPPNVTDDPGFQFRLQQGQQAIERSAAARGGLTSGGTLKALEQYSQGLASDEYANAYARALTQYGIGRENFYQNQANAFNRPLQVAGLGVAGAQGAAAALGAQGNAGAAGSINAGNAWSGGVSNATNLASNYLTLSQLMGGGNSGGNYTLVNPYSSPTGYVAPAYTPPEQNLLPQ
jgi:hypothetical protein